MFNLFNHYLSILAVVFLSLLFVRCENGGSELPNELHGVVVSNNRAPAPNVKIGLYSVNYIPADSGKAEQAWTAKTDASGKYAFKNIPQGRYNIVGLQDSLGFFRDSISITGNEDLGQDSLGRLGTISGLVQLQPEVDPRNAMIQVMGTENYVNVDSTGAFTLYGLASGVYRIRVFVALPEYVPLFKAIEIQAGQRKTLLAPLVPFFSGTPLVINITASLDTARGIAKITWHPVSYSAFQTYLVFRDEENTVNLSTRPLNSFRITDTVYYDTLYRNYGGRRSGFDSIGAEPIVNKWEYRVKVKTKQGSIGGSNQTAILHAIPPPILITSVNIKLLQTTMDSAFWDSTGRDLTNNVFKGDTVRFVANFNNPSLTNKSIAWFHSGEGTIRKAELTDKIGSDTLVWVASAIIGNDSLSVEVTDITGAKSYAWISFRIGASRLIGKLNTVSFDMDAYAWRGNVVHVSTNDNGKIQIGYFNITTRQDSTLNVDSKAIGLPSTAFWGSKLYLANAIHPNFPGAKLLTFDLATGLWDKEPNPPFEITSKIAAANGRLCATSNTQSPGDSNQIAVLDLNSHTWTKKANRGKRELSAGVWFTEAGGTLYLTSNTSGPYNFGLEEYSPESDSYKTLAFYHGAFHGDTPRIASINGKLYIMGVVDSNLKPAPRVDVLNPTQGEWLPALPFLIGRTTPAVLVIGKSIYLMGGQTPLNQNVISNTIEEYRPE